MGREIFVLLMPSESDGNTVTMASALFFMSAFSPV